MSKAVIKNTGADYSVGRIGYHAGPGLLSPYAFYLFGSKYRAPSNAELYDWSGNGRTLTRVNTPVVNNAYYNGLYTAYFQTPFDLTALMTSASGCTLTSISRGVTAGSSQIVGNIPTDASQYIGLGHTSSNMQAYMKGASPVTANRPLDAGKFGYWQFTAARFTATECSIFVYRSDLGTTQKVTTVTSGQTFVSSHLFRIGSAENTNTATRDIAHVGFYNTPVIDSDMDLLRDNTIFEAYLASSGAIVV